MDDHPGMNPTKVSAAQPEFAPPKGLPPAPAPGSRTGGPGEDELFRDPFADFSPSER